MSSEAILTPWEEKPLLDCTIDGVISYGIVQPGHHQGDGVPIVRVNNFNNGTLETSDVLRVARSIENNYQRTRLNGGEVLLTVVGSVGQTAIVPISMKGWNVARAVAVIRPAAAISARWLVLCLQSSAARSFLDGRANTTVQKTLNLGDVKQLPIILPPSGIRKRIEAIAESIEGKIDLNRRINQTLEAMAQAIFKSWFVDFDPVKAKISAIEEGRDPLRAAMSCISGKGEAELDTMPREQYEELAATAALFPEEMEESGLGEIPKGWAFSEIRSLAEVISKGTTPSKADISGAQDDRTVPFLKVRDISKDGEISRADLELIAKSIHNNSLKRSILSTDDLLFSIAGTIGRIAIVDEDLHSSNLNQAIAFIRLKDKRNYLNLCWLTLQSSDTSEFIASKVVQGVQANVSLAHVGAIPITLPHPKLLHFFNSIVGPMITDYRLRQAENRSLASLRDTILPKLLSGEISVADTIAEVKA